MSAAKQAFNDVLDAVPEEVELGIRTLGADYPGDDRKVGCKDTKQLYPVGPLDRTEAKTAVATLRPTGWTPIGPALLGAADDLEGGDATRRIVLITDGEDTCGPLDPCEVAREHRRPGHPPGHRHARPGARTPRSASSCTCIAEATGGTYTAVQHTDELSGRVKQLVDRAAEPVVTPVATEGAGSCSAAPELKAGPLHRPPGDRRAPLVPGGRPARPGTARLGERRGGPRREQRLRGAAARRDRARPGDRPGRRSPAPGVRTSSPPGCATRSPSRTTTTT